MLGLYLYTLIIGHKYCNMLSTVHCILNKLTLQKKLQNFVKKLCVLDKKIKTQKQQKIEHKTLAGAGN